MPKPTQKELEDIAVELIVLNEPVLTADPSLPLSIKREYDSAHDVWVVNNYYRVSHNRVQQVWLDRQGVKNLADRVQVLEALVAALVRQPKNSSCWGCSYCKQEFQDYGELIKHEKTCPDKALGPTDSR